MIPLDKETFEAYMERLLEQVEKVVGALDKIRLSLVGSEMCIRDRYGTVARTSGKGRRRTGQEE